MAQGRLVTAVLAGLVLAIASGLSFLWNTGRSAEGWPIPPALASHPERDMAAANLAFRRSGGSVNGIDLQGLNAALARAPLEDEPFTYAAAHQMADGTATTVDDLLHIAEARNPRSKEARVLLLYRAANRLDAQEAVTQIEVLYRLERERRPILRDLLIYLASLPATQEATLAGIEDESHKREIIQGLARWGASASTLLSALDTLGEFDVGPDRQGFVRSLVNPLLGEGDWAGARRVWEVYYPDAPDDRAVVADETFTGAFAPPFGWLANSGEDVPARFSAEGLAGTYYGDAPQEIARQYVLADPGAYRLLVESARVGNGVNITLACAGAGPFIETRLFQRSQSVDFTLPDDCPALEIAMFAQPGKDRSSSRFLINSVRLEPVT